MGRPLQLKLLTLIAVTYLLLHGLCITIFPAHAMAVSYGFMVPAPLLAFSACIWRTRSSSRDVRLVWALVCGGLLLWLAGIVLSAWEDMAAHISISAAYFSDFMFFIYGIPILLAISFPNKSGRTQLSLGLDGIQAAISAYLIYITFFSVSPFTHQPIQPIPVSVLVWIYNLENIALASGATLRLLAYPYEGEKRYFYQALSIFLWIYAVCLWLYNYRIIATDNQVGVYHVLADVPFLFLMVAALVPAGARKRIEATRDRKPLAQFIDNVSPIFYTSALLLLSFTVMRHHFFHGVFAIVLALGVYTVRAAVLQIRYTQSERALREARDRLEAISLTDALTGVANRRCFDKTIGLEWNRAARSRQPLALLMIDVDHFKNLNDREGHPRGDECLVRIAEALRTALPRSGDHLARYGGEEFVTILPATGQGGAKRVAVKMQEAVKALKIPNESESGEYVTISIGFSVCGDPRDATSAALIEASDNALYRAKANGRDRVEYIAL